MLLGMKELFHIVRNELSNLYTSFTNAFHSDLTPIVYSKNMQPVVIHIQYVLLCAFDMYVDLYTHVILCDKRMIHAHDKAAHPCLE